MTLKDKVILLAFAAGYLGALYAIVRFIHPGAAFVVMLLAALAGAGADGDIDDYD